MNRMLKRILAASDMQLIGNIKTYGDVTFLCNKCKCQSTHTLIDIVKRTARCLHCDAQIINPDPPKRAHRKFSNDEVYVNLYKHGLRLENTLKGLKPALISCGKGHTFQMKPHYAVDLTICPYCAGIRPVQ